MLNPVQNYHINEAGHWNGRELSYDMAVMIFSSSKGIEGPLGRPFMPVEKLA